MAKESTNYCLAILVVLLITSVSVKGIPLEDFFPFGADVGDTPLLKELDTSSPLVQLNISTFPFFGQDHSGLYVNANGDISFLARLSAFVPQPFPLDFQLIAPFWADSDTRPPDGGDVWYRETDDPALLERAKEIVRNAFLNHATFEPESLFIATWDHIGVYPQLTHVNNTFQCVLTTDGVRSFVMFLYADGLIQWLWSQDHEGIPGQVGFNAGDGVRFFSHPDSMTERLLNISETSNIGIPGVWLFRVDKEDIVSGGCSSTEDAQITLTPRHGNMLGGTGVIITGVCLEPDDRVLCSFDEKPAQGSESISDSLILCVSPVLNKIGAVSFELTVAKASLREFFTFTATFYSVSPERGHAIDFAPDKLLFAADDTYELNWSPNFLGLDIPTNPFTVDIEMYQQRFVYSTRERSNEANWRRVARPLATDAPNDGHAIVQIPSVSIQCKYPKSVQFMFPVCPVVIKISASRRSAQIRSMENVTLPATVGQWTGIAYMKSKDCSAGDMRSICDSWFMVEENAGTSFRLRDLTACPPLENQAELDTTYEREDLSSFVRRTSFSENSQRFFHPNTTSCYRQTRPTEENYGQQCCYDDDGNLLIGSPGGGSADSVSPNSDYNLHLIEDLVPYIVCCKSGESTSNCGAYYDQRPSRSEAGYALPVPACIYGDPHIVTLDGLKYTFNGKGEFVLIETNDNSFTLQGRMEPAQDADGFDSLGTVFTAIVARQEETNTVVQFEIRPMGIRTIVDGLTVEFDDVDEQNFINVTVKDKGNNTVVATFTSGVSIELKADNGIISLMLVSLPGYLKGETRGLMGNFNGDPSDDLLPKFGSEPLKPEASIEEIHEFFGMTWIINDTLDSIFTYRPGDSWSEFYDPDFVPVYEPVFNNSSLEDEAKSVCGDDVFCLFDIATTKRVDIGASTVEDSQGFDNIVELSKPIVCDPPCENGACVENNTCRCMEGFVGERCTEPVMTECESNVCKNNGTCVKHVATYTCMCSEGYIGAFCQEKEPPFHIRFINSSPRVNEDQVLIDFTGSMPIIKASCFLTGRPEQDCSSESVVYSNVSKGSYIFRVVATSERGERAVERRLIHVGDEEELCAVHLINEGVRVDGQDVFIQFTGIGPITSYQCKLDGSNLGLCQSPMHIFKLDRGTHRLQVIPSGCSGETKKLSVKFYIP